MDNPTEWVKHHLEPAIRWDKQKEIIESVRDHKNTYVKSCHGIGKTFTAKDVVMWFLYTHPNCKIITTAPSWPQVEKLLWSEINNCHKKAKANLGGKCLTTEIKIDEDWFALGLSPRIDNDDEAKRFTGFHASYILIVFDEAPDVSAKLWKIKETLMTGDNVRFLGIGNPVSEHGDFYDGFTNPLVNSISMNIFDSPNFKENDINCLDDLIKISEEVRAITDINKYKDYWKRFKNPYPKLTIVRWAVERLIEWGKDSPIFVSRVLGDFPKTTTDTIISLHDLNKNVENEVSGKTKKILSVDVARFGSDDTVMFGFEHHNQIYKDKWNGQDTVKTANRIKNKIKEGYTVVVIDDTGVGGGVTDQVKAFVDESVRYKEVEVIAVCFGSGAEDDDMYKGITTELWFNAKKIIEERRLNVIDKDNLFNELTSRKYKFTTKGQYQVESKDEYKKRTGKRSPDEADAFILGCWAMRDGQDYEFEKTEERIFAHETRRTVRKVW